MYICANPNTSTFLINMSNWRNLINSRNLNRYGCCFNLIFNLAHVLQSSSLVLRMWVEVQRFEMCECFVSPWGRNMRRGCLVPRRIFETTREAVQGMRSKLQNEKIRKSYSLPNTIRLIKSRILRQAEINQVWGRWIIRTKL